MKSLKEFITENLENSTVTTVQESTEKQVDENNNLEEGQADAKPNEDKTNETKK
ncbi:hypothetical protein [Chryseobacterium sp. Marseille-Q3244]|uniref:hypothetical protein n=1 Tax=Chryseobacterium sp. Marseille-Q3244 TaxID=2758092 RepID=UPI002024D5AF|nr:hypothetical protein [Chryseobacterium sp. Marseille-Q3244]